MLGTPVNCTIFVCVYSFKKPARKSKVPGAAKKEDDLVSNRIIIVAGNPTGEDCFHIVRRLVLGEIPYPGSDFKLISCDRMNDAMGLAGITTWEKLDGKAPQEPGFVVNNGEESEADEGDDEGGSVPPAAALN